MACSWRRFAQLLISMVWSYIWGNLWPHLDKTVSWILKTFMEMLWIAVQYHVKEHIVCLLEICSPLMYCWIQWYWNTGNHTLNFLCHFDLLASLHQFRSPRWEVAILLYGRITRKWNVRYTVFCACVTDSRLHWNVWLSHRWCNVVYPRVRSCCGHEISVFSWTPCML